MSLVRGAIVSLFAAACSMSAIPSAEAERAGTASTLLVLEGTVVARDEVKAEGDLPVVRVHVETDDGVRRVLLAPRAILDEIDCPVDAGDRLRARVFAAEPGEDVAAHKIFNMTKERMARLRTLRRDPLWDNAGVWQGGRRHRHGGGGPPEGAGRGPGGKRGRGGR